MAIVTTDNQHFMDIAAAIRAKNGTDTQYTPAEMPAAIQAISGGGEPEPPDDGKTRLYINVPENAMEGLPPPRADVPLYIAQTVSNGVSIDWGDGSEPETISGTGNVKTTHHYASGGDYVITLAPSDGCELNFGWNDSENCIMGYCFDTGLVYCGMLRKVITGKNVPKIAETAFYRCGSLSTVIMSGDTKIIGMGAYGEDDSIASILIGETVNEIESSAFVYCYGIKEFHIRSKIPPVIQDDTFFGVPADAVYYVPKGSLSEYRTATNWSLRAERIQEEPT